MKMCLTIEIRDGVNTTPHIHSLVVHWTEQNIVTITEAAQNRIYVCSLNCNFMLLIGTNNDRPINTWQCSSPLFTNVSYLTHSCAALVFPSYLLLSFMFSSSAYTIFIQHFTHLP
jgi:hypothetical protein